MVSLRPLPATLPLPSASSAPASPVLFRPRGFAPPRRLPPHADSWACCIPLPIRVRRVSAPCPPLAARAIREDDLALRPVSLGLSRCALHTPRRSPPRCSRVASLRPLPPRRCACARGLSEDNFRSPTLDLEALLRVRVRSDRCLLPGADRPLLPWASFPSRVLAKAARSDPRCLHHGPFRAAPPDLRPHCCARRPPPPLPPTEAAPVAERRTSRISPTRREDIPPTWFADPCCQGRRQLGVCPGVSVCSPTASADSPR